MCFDSAEEAALCFLQVVGIERSGPEPLRMLESLLQLVAKLVAPRAVQELDQPAWCWTCLLYTSPSPRDVEESRMPSSA